MKLTSISFHIYYIHNHLNRFEKDEHPAQTDLASLYVSFNREEVLLMTSSIIYLPHGGGPLPLLGETNHLPLIQFLKELPKSISEPRAILVISAHWEEPITTVSSHSSPSMVYDYYGFAAESYQIDYPAPGSPQLASKIEELLKVSGIKVKQDKLRGFDHGTFVPLKLMYPNANIPVVQVSLTTDLDAEFQINLGQCLAELTKDNIMIIGSGLSFHNLNVMMSNGPDVLEKSQLFDRWLNQVILNEKLPWRDKAKQLIDWQKAPHARFAHPREEHLLPLHVCFGAAMKLKLNAKNIFDQIFLNTKISGFLWNEI